MTSWSGRLFAASMALSLVVAGGGSQGSGGAAPSVPATAPASERGAPARRSTPVTDVLGIRIGMPGTEAHRRLAPLGVRDQENEEIEEEGTGEVVGRELWTLTHTDFRYVLLGVDRQGRVASLQAFARPGVRKLRYRDLGDLAQARRLGFYIYEWRVPAAGGGRGLRVEARGTDPEYLGSYQVVRERLSPVAEAEARREPTGAAPDSSR